MQFDLKLMLLILLFISALTSFFFVLPHAAVGEPVGNQTYQFYANVDVKHVLVTGGAGFIGSHASLRLLESKVERISVIDNLSRGNAGAVKVLQGLYGKDKVKFYNVDLGNLAAVKEAFRSATEGGLPIDVVIHFAAIAYVGESMAEPLLYYSNITSNTNHLLEAMKASGVKNLVYSSTCAVYGNQDVLPITEHSPPRPNNPYGESKFMAENIIRAYARSDRAFRSIILRYFNVFGSDPNLVLGEDPRPELRQHSRISGACMNAALGLEESLTIKGTNHKTKDGTCVRDYIHVEDLVQAHLLALNNTSNPPPLYNIGTGAGVSVREFVNACLKVTGKDIKVIEQGQARPGDYSSVYADPSKIIRELGFKPRFKNVEDGLRHAWEWRSKNPNGYPKIDPSEL